MELPKTYLLQKFAKSLLAILFLLYAPIISANPNASNAYILIAHPQMLKPEFKQTVVLVMAHMGQNAVGVILNKPMPMPLSQFFPDDLSAKKHNEPVFFGGPLSGQVYTFIVKSESKPTPTLPIIENHWLGADSALLKQLLVSSESVRIFKGYSGWAPGQLEAEINHGIWYIIPARADILLHNKPSSLWQDLIATIDGNTI